MVTLVSSSISSEGGPCLTKRDRSAAMWPRRGGIAFLTETALSVNLVAMVTDINSTEVGQICRKCRMKIDRNPMYTEHPNFIPPKVCITNEFAI